MPVTASSRAAARAAGVNNTVLNTVANDVPRNIVVVGTFNPALAGGIVAEVPRQISSPAQGGVLYGQGYMLHRLLKAAFAGMPSGGATVWAIPQAETGGAAAATSVNTLALTGPSTAAGVLAIYISNIRYALSVASGAAAADIATALAALINADPDCPVSAVAATVNVVLTAKSKGPWGNSTPIAANIQAGDALPAGVTVTITALTGGTGIPTIANALNALGTGSNANTLPNGQGMTDLVHGYLAAGTTMAATAQDQTTAAAVSAYNGLVSADPPVGCYDHLVGKPFRCLLGDNTNSASVPAALTAFAQANLQDRTHHLLAVAGSRSHPCEAAASALAAINVITGQVAAAPYVDAVIPGVEPGPSGMWTADYTLRDTAVKAGISPTLVSGGAVLLQNLVTFCIANPAIPISNNGYAESVSIAKLQNILASMLSTFRGPKWKQVVIVSDTSRVTDVNAKARARSISDVIDELVALAKAWEGKALIYSADVPIAALAAGGLVAVRSGGDGFTARLPGILSGMGNIIDATLDFDVAISG